MANIKEEGEEFATCFRIFGAACFFVGLFIIPGLVMGVMATPF